MPNSAKPEQANKLVSLAMVAAVGTFAAIHALYYLPRTVDDMFIFLRYAENIAAGDGVVYNLGEQVEGLSSPLWTLLLAIGELIGLGGVSWAKALGIASFVLLSIGTYRFAREVAYGSRTAAWLGVLALALNSYVMSWTLWGLETPLHLAMMMWTAVFAWRVTERGTRRDVIGLCVAGIAFVWGRPEAPLFLALIGFGVAFRDRKTYRERIRRALVPGLVVSAAWVAMMVARRLYFGVWLPHTHYAKQGHGFDVERLGSLVVQGASPLEVAVLVLGLAAGVWWMTRGRHTPLLILLGNIFFVSVVRLDWMPNVRHFLPLTILLPVMVLAASDELRRHAGWRRMSGVVGTLLVVGNAFLIARTDSRFSPNDFRTHGGGENWVRPKSLEAWDDTMDCLARRTPAHIDAMNEFDHGMITQLYRVLEASADPLDESWYVARDIGRVGWLSPVKVFDTDGLFTPAVVQSEAWQDGEVVDADLINTALDRNVVGTELFGTWMQATMRSRVARQRYRPIPGMGYPYLRPVDVESPSRDTILERYEAALAKMPSSYYLMTLYGEGVGAAIERRVESVRFHLETPPTVNALPDDLEGGVAVLDGSIELFGCRAPAAVERGTRFRLECFFQPNQPVRRDYTVFVHLEGPGGQRVVADHAPGGGFHPSTEWEPGAIVRTGVSVQMPEEATSLRAWVGLFMGNHRARVTGGTTDNVGRVRGPEIRAL